MSSEVDWILFLVEQHGSLEGPYRLQRCTAIYDLDKSTSFFFVTIFASFCLSLQKLSENVIKEVMLKLLCEMW